MKKGFTLIELVVVIAILGVLAAVLVTVIDPLDKINSANDSGAISTTAQIGKANDSYASSHNNTFVGGTLTATVSGSNTTYSAGPLTDLNSSGEVKMTQVVLPSVYGLTYAALQSDKSTACTTAGGNCGVYMVYVSLQSKKYTSGNTSSNKSYYVYTNGQGCTKLNQAAAPALATVTCP